ncbi:MAG: cytochrome P460 family protein [Proteobacteria bacterium]|nr:cytochrome P460 family protein [Pseudomonadota bacterium]
MIQNPLTPTYGVSRRNELLSVPVLNAENEQQLPVDLDRWMHLGMMLGPQYTDEGFDARGSNLFHSALMEPTAYQAFLDTGEFGDGTIFALRFYNALSELSIQKSGFLMGDFTLTEIHLKDSKQFQDGFNFYLFPPGTEKAPPLPLPNDCVSWHREHGAYDGVFAQFYPALRDKIPSSDHN